MAPQASYFHTHASGSEGASGLGMQFGGYRIGADLCQSPPSDQFPLAFRGYEVLRVPLLSSAQKRRRLFRGSCP